LRNIVKKDELLAEIQVSSKRAGLDKMTEGEIDREIKATRRTKKTK